MMDDEDDEKTCAICFEERNDIRMLPCWHVACLKCIMGMTQNGKIRAVSCHACRQPCLFENIRSLPRPVRCQKCKLFLKSPRKFSCCSRLYCFSCIETIQSPEFKVRCPANCSKKLHRVETLQLARICSLCFRMHTENDVKCGHSFCGKCQRRLNAQRRECPLCLAVKNPFPAPINPIQPNQEHVSASLESLNNEGVVDSRQTDISEITIFSAMQSIRSWQQGNTTRPTSHRRSARSQQQQQQQQELPQYTNKEFMIDLPKGGIFLITLVMMIYYQGLGFLIWIVCGSILYLSNPTAVFTTNICIALWILAWIVSFYSCFGLTVFIDVIYTGISYLIQKITKFFIRDEFFEQLVSKFKLGVYFFILWWYFPPIILHRNMLGSLAPILADKVKIRELEILGLLDR
ncbi:uncharacterized protein LOC120348478 [Styela clava]